MTSVGIECQRGQEGIKYLNRPAAYLPGQQLLRLQLYCFFIGCLRLIWLFQFTGCQPDEYPGIVIILFQFQYSLKPRLREQSQLHNIFVYLSEYFSLRYFTLQCFSASLNSLFFMASLALFSAAFTSLLDISWTQ